MSDTDPFCLYVEWIKNRGITLGSSPTTYDPNNPVTRLQMAAFLYRLGYQNAFLQGGNAFGTTAVLGTTDTQRLELRARNRRIMRYDYSLAHPNIIAGPGGVEPGVYGATIAGGSSEDSFGLNSWIYGNFGTVGGGSFNMAGADNKPYATISGGFENRASGRASSVAGGYENRATGDYAFAGGGRSNSATGLYSTAVGGEDNTASGNYALAIGRRASATLPGCFVWADSVSSNITSCFSNNEFIARATGGFYFWTAGSNDANYSGARLASGTGAWAAYSDRAGKDRVEPVDTARVLDRVASLPIATWRWKEEAGDVRHMGPMAQDFHAAFGLGARDTEIVSVDSDGVALAAIQGLNAKVERQAAKLAQRDVELAELKAELAAIREALALR